MVINDEIGHREEKDSSRNHDQSEFEPDSQGEEDEAKNSRHITETKVQSFQTVTN